jgi:hypothetical protein
MGGAAVDALARRAVAWALDHVGSTGCAGRCLGFVEDAYERSNAIEVFGGDSAAPRLSGWPSPQRVLRDHRARSWAHG